MYDKLKIMNLNIQDKFNKELPADSNRDNNRRQVLNACFSYVNPTKPEKSSLIHASTEVANLLGISMEELKSKSFLNIFTGVEVLQNKLEELGSTTKRSWRNSLFKTSRWISSFKVFN